MGAFAALFDEMREGVQILDDELRYLYLNRTALEHGRSTREALLGIRMQDAYPGIENTEIFRLIRRTLATREPSAMINEFEYPDGRRGWFDLRVSPVPAGVVVFSIDVTTIRHAEEELRNSKETLGATLQSMQEGVATTDEEGRIVSMNPMAESLLGCSEVEARGQHLERLVEFRDEENTRVRPMTSVLETKTKLRLPPRTKLVTNDDDGIAVGGSASPLIACDGRTRGVVLVLSDQREQEGLTAMLLQSQKMEAIGRLAGGIAHDLNNLLFVMNGYCDLLTRHAQDEKSRAWLAEVTGASESAAALIRQLLAFSRKQVLKPQPLDANLLVEKTSAMIARVIGDDIEVVLKLQAELGIVSFDPVQIEQVLMNLAVNSRDAMPNGGRLTIETANVELDEQYARSHPGARVGPHVMIAVSDNGIGMDEATRARMFEPFFTTKEKGVGTGLGLAMVHGIVQQGGGTIWAYSELGRGTTFKIYLPRGAEIVPRAVEVGEADPRVSSGHTVLVVEDQAQVLKLVCTVLEEAGYVVLSASNAEDGLALCADHCDQVHVLLTDVVMPKMNGPQLAIAARALCPSLKVVFMSGYTDSNVVDQGLLDPHAAFVEKPIAPAGLLDMLRAILGQ